MKKIPTYITVVLLVSAFMMSLVSTTYAQTSEITGLGTLTDQMYLELQNYEEELNEKLSAERDLRTQRFELFRLRGEITTYSTGSQEYIDLASQITATEGYIPTIVSDIAEREANLSAIEQRLDSLSGQIDRLANDPDYEYYAEADYLDQVSSKTAQLEIANERLGLVNEELAEKQDELAVLESSLHSQNDTLDTYIIGTLQYDSQLLSISSLEGLIDDVSDEINVLEGQVFDGQALVNSLSTQLGILSAATTNTSVTSLVTTLPVTSSGPAAGTNLGSLLFEISNVVNTAIPVVFALALLYFFWGLAVFVRKAGGGEQEEGKKKMIWGIVTLFVMVSVWGLVNFISDIFNIDPEIHQVSSGSLR